MRALLYLLLLLPVSGLLAQTDSLLRSFNWVETETDLVLQLTPDGTFEQDYGEGAKPTRYLMGRYATDSTGRQITLSVDYFLGKSRLDSRYRRGQDFYLDYSIDSLSAERLVLQDILTGEVREFTARPKGEEADPARRRIPKPDFGPLRLPERGIN